MPNLIKSEKDLIRFFDKASFIEKTFQQINKDLDSEEHALSWESIDMDEDVLPQFTTLLVPVLKSLSTERLSTFIYRVDLQENRFLQFLSDQNFEQFAFEIILREAQKVYLRIQFA